MSYRDLGIRRQQVCEWRTIRDAGWEAVEGRAPTKSGIIKHVRSARVARAMCFTRGRVKFLNPEGAPSPAPLQGQTVFYVGPDPSKFCAVFNEFGLVLPAAWPDERIGQ